MDGRIVTFAMIIFIGVVCAWLAFKPERREEMACICIDMPDGSKRKVVGCPEHPEALEEAIEACKRVPGCTCALCNPPKEKA